MTLNRMAIGSETTLKPTRSPSCAAASNFEQLDASLSGTFRHANSGAGGDVPTEEKGGSTPECEARAERRRAKEEVRATQSCGRGLLLLLRSLPLENRLVLPLPLLSFRLDELTFHTHTSTHYSVTITTLTSLLLLENQLVQSTPSSSSKPAFEERPSSIQFQPASSRHCPASTQTAQTLSQQPFRNHTHKHTRCDSLPLSLLRHRSSSPSRRAHPLPRPAARLLTVTCTS